MGEQLQIRLIIIVIALHISQTWNHTQIIWNENYQKLMKAMIA